MHLESGTERSREEGLRMEVAAGCEPEVVGEVIAGAVHRFRAPCSVALLVKAMLQPGQDKRQSLAEVTQDDLDIRRAIKQAT
jgi:hypothetical protein